MVEIQVLTHSRIFFRLSGCRILHPWIAKTQKNSSKSMLDRFLMSVVMITEYPFALEHAAERPFSDHMPLIWMESHIFLLILETMALSTEYPRDC